MHPHESRNAHSPTMRSSTPRGLTASEVHHDWIRRRGAARWASGENMRCEVSELVRSRIHDRLVNDRRFEPLGSEQADIESFRDHDLASLVESRLGEAVDPAHFDDTSRRQWL